MQMRIDIAAPAGGAHNLVSILARPSRQMQQAAVHGLASLAHRFAEPVAQVMLEQSGGGRAAAARTLHAVVGTGRTVPGMQCTPRDVGLGRQLCMGSRHVATPGWPQTVQCVPHLQLHTARQFSI